jgi:hypothetical protein
MGALAGYFTWSLLRKALPWLLLLAAMGATYIVWGWKEEAQAKQALAEQQLSIAIEVNKANALEAERARRQEEADRRTTAAELDATAKRTNTITVLKKEQRNAPDANDAAGPYFDDFADRLRQSRGTGP